MKNKVAVNWTEDMSFDALVNDHKIVLDAAKLLRKKPWANVVPNP
ncbi:MAG: hypothetical protein R2764_07605 [Bacteroidales bacterium]